MIGFEPMTCSLRERGSALIFNNLHKTVVDFVGMLCYIKNR